MVKDVLPHSSAGRLDIELRPNGEDDLLLARRVWHDELKSAHFFGLVAN